jgi:hypothetical protein
VGDGRPTSEGFHVNEHPSSRRGLRALLPPLLAAATLAAFVSLPLQAAQAATGCTAGMSQVACENLQPGTSEDEWQVPYGQAATDIEGFTTDISVNIGSTLNFKVNESTTTSNFQIDIYRLGYYQGNGARKIATISNVAGKKNAACLQDTTTGLIDCGNWAQSASWSVPSTAVSGVYVANFTRNDNGDVSQAPFIVRNDASHSDIVFQTSDPTWEAYNDWGGNDFYVGNPVGRAYKLSYNRPFHTRSGQTDRDYLFSNEFPMIEYLESNGYDVSYISGVDTDRNGSLLTNHKAFMSTGHDEYWSGNQRANVESARDHGVSLAFFSGNEVYWKTRYEPSLDSSQTNYRTLVTYKETWANAKIDPSPEWTGTWRDPRFSPPSNGGRPENGLTGTMYMANCCNAAITVPQADGQMRFWRDTSVATQAAGATATLAPNTLGYEFDESPDNGFQPAGLVPLSSTTQDTSQYLLDYGSTTGNGTAHHHMTLYRASSGALVFSSGSVQWAWGLEDDHDGVESPPDVRMQQATMNLFADMGVQPTTPQAGLVPTPASTDHTAPTATITSPTAGATIAGGSAFTITGTAVDAGGGTVGAVEVSMDGGQTWHPATGRGTWSYSWVPNGQGPVTVEARATDDSGNIQSSPATVAVNTACPCTIFGGKALPPITPSTDSSAISVGTKFTSDSDGFISGVQFWKESTNTGTHTGSLWTASGTKLATGTFTNETASGWQTLTFSSPVAIAANTTYVVSYYGPNGHETGTSGGYTNAVNSPPLHGLADGSSGGNGVYTYGSDTFPTSSFGASNYWVDPIFLSSLPNDHTPPTVSPLSPTANATGVTVKTTAVAKFSEPIKSSTLSMSVTTSGGATVAGSVAYDNQALTATFTPSANLATNTAYTVKVSATDLSGNAMPSPSSWSFTTSMDPAGCPCTLFGSTIPSTPAASDSAAVSLGVKFTSDSDGVVAGVRFYKGSSAAGTHTGSLFTASGTRLATGTFTSETTSGWQTLTFSQPVPVTAGTTYVASYYAPQGNYVATSGFFNAGTDTPPLHAPSSSASGGNGVYTYGSDTFPTSSYGASNYWVDPIFQADPSTPSVQTPTPTPGATGVSVKTPIQAAFSQPVVGSSVQFSLKTTSGTAVAGTVSYNAPSFTASFTPTSSLTPSTSYTATVSGAKTSLGVSMASPVSWSFTTSADPSGCPCNIFGTTTPASPAANDSSAISLGVKFTSDNNGWISGVRFYKGPGNGGTHTGSLWSSTGTRLATGTFTNETAGGWQTLTFATPVAVTSGTTYVASYYAPQGHYAADANVFNSQVDAPPLHAPSSSASGGNGVYTYGGDVFPSSNFSATNYYVDATLQLTAPPDTTPPTASVVAPASGATGVSINTKPQVSFSESVVSSSISFTLKTSGGTAVSGTTAYDDPSKTATFTPSAALAVSTTYTATVSGAKDASGNTMSPLSWSFTTSSDPSGCPCTLFGTTVPATPSANDSSAISLGVKFTSDFNGFVRGIRFYKGGSGNGGTHTGSLWSSTGTRMATGTFTNETASGWQTLTFSAPVAVTAGTTYIASYYAPQGNYAVTSSQFTNQFDNAPLHAPSSSASGGNGVYLYGSDGFPTGSFNATNYGVDLIFTRT